MHIKELETKYPTAQASHVWGTSQGHREPAQFIDLVFKTADEAKGCVSSEPDSDYHWETRGHVVTFPSLDGWKAYNAEDHG